MKAINAAGMLFAMAVAAACSGSDGADRVADGRPSATAVELPDGVTGDMVAQGQTLFNQQTCFTCHGRNGTGSPLAPAFTDQQWLNIDGSFDAIVEVIRTGVAQPRQFSAPMPAMGGTRLTEEQIRQLAAYVYAASRGG